MIQYYMVALILIVPAAYFIVKRKSQISKRMGFLSWILLVFYFPAEVLVISGTTSAYNFMMQPMSDLGVTECMAHAYSLAPYHICSPLSGLMNITFIITGVLITFGAILLHRFWGDSGRTRTATGMWILYGLGYSVSGIYPADINFGYIQFFHCRACFCRYRQCSSLQKLSGTECRNSQSGRTFAWAYPL